MVNEAGELGASPGVESETVELHVWGALATVHDPEIPPCSITDLGIVERVRVDEGVVEVELVPTFSGCPALDVIREDAEDAVRPVAGDREVRVRFVNAPPWTSDRISADGRRALREYGIEPPGERSPGGPVFIPLASLVRSEGGSSCPFCGSDDTVLESAFGPTLCRATRFCRSCRNPYESFKPKGAGAA
jgi:ring-1,2-phenylacetyl-CoA epoxidase subunit PaaD